MTGTTEVFGTSVVGHALHRGHRALVGRNPGRRVDMVNGDRERSRMIVRIVLDHLVQVEFLGIFSRHGHADEPFAVRSHEVDIFRGGEFRRADEVAFVLAIRVVGDENDLAVLEIFKSFLHRVELGHRPFFP